MGLIEVASYRHSEFERCYHSFRGIYLLDRFIINMALKIWIEKYEKKIKNSNIVKKTVKKEKYKRQLASGWLAIESKLPSLAPICKFSVLRYA